MDMPIRKINTLDGANWLSPRGCHRRISPIVGVSLTTQ